MVEALALSAVAADTGVEFDLRPVEPLPRNPTEAAADLLSMLRLCRAQGADRPLRMPDEIRQQWRSRTFASLRLCVDLTACGADAENARQCIALAVLILLQLACVPAGA